MGNREPRRVTERKPWPTKLGDLMNIRHDAVLLRDVSTKVGTLPKGTHGKVWTSGNSWSDLRFNGVGCKRCGIALNARGLNRDDVALLDVKPRAVLRRVVDLRGTTTRPVLVLSCGHNQHRKRLAIVPERARCYKCKESW